MQATTSRADFEALLRRAGLELQDEEIAELHGVWPHYEKLLLRLRGDGRARAAEPAHIFVPGAAR